ncbi:MAG: porphobilinogen synthase [Gammaproteobacteria bacterium]
MQPLASRYRRLRRTGAMRDLARETLLTAHDFIYPIFVEEGLRKPLEIASMPGVRRWPEDGFEEQVQRAAEAGLRAVILFGVSRSKDAIGTDAMRDDGLLARMTEKAKAAAPDLVLMTDTCFCEYTDHGHCGVLAGGEVDNDATVQNLAAQALVAARAGADVIAPSAMMDGQVAAIRAALDSAGFSDTAILAYSSKFASSFYGPFREAAGCDLEGDRKTYQMDPANAREAIKESLRDEAEGADMLMVKPGLPYLDIITRLRERTLLPIVAYQTSGEYSMIKIAANAKAIDERAAMLESLVALKRAGADLILSYFAVDAAQAIAGS